MACHGMVWYGMGWQKAQVIRKQPQMKPQAVLVEEANPRGAGAGGGGGGAATTKAKPPKRVEPVPTTGNSVIRPAWSPLPSVVCICISLSVYLCIFKCVSVSVDVAVAVAVAVRTSAKRVAAAATAAGWPAARWSLFTPSALSPCRFRLCTLPPHGLLYVCGMLQSRSDLASNTQKKKYYIPFCSRIWNGSFTLKYSKVFSFVLIDLWYYFLSSFFLYNI